MLHSHITFTPHTLVKTHACVDSEGNTNVYQQSTAMPSKQKKYIDIYILYVYLYVSSICPHDTNKCEHDIYTIRT